MKPKFNFRVAIAMLSVLGFTATSQAAVIASDDFSYPNANDGLNGQNGGTGFSDAWSTNNQVKVIDGVIETRPYNTPYGTRTLAAPIADTGTLWVSFDWGYTSSPSANNWGGLTFFNSTLPSGNERLIIGNTYGQTTWGVGGAGISITQTTEASYSGMKTGVAKITMGTGATDTIELWVGEAGAPVNVSGVAMATALGLDLAGVDYIRVLGSKDTVSQMDNLIIADSISDVPAVIPEPSAALLGVLGLGLMLRRRRN